MKKLILILFTLISFSAMAQKKDSILNKVDTLRIPVYERTDTLPVKGVLYKFKNEVRVSMPAFVIAKGFKVKNQRNEFEWAEQPQILGFLNQKKKPVKNFIQIIQ